MLGTILNFEELLGSLRIKSLEVRGNKSLILAICKTSLPQIFRDQQISFSIIMFTHYFVFKKAQ